MTIKETHFGPVWFIPGENSGKYPYCHSIYIEGPGILIDPASDRNRLQALKNGPGVNEVWLTHWHEDHFMHLDLFDDRPLKTSREDAGPLKDLDSLEEAYGMEGELQQYFRQMFVETFNFRPRVPTGYLEDGQIFSFDNVTVEIILTPGHTPGSLSFLFREPGILFLGDYDLTAFGPWYGDIESSIEDTIASVRRLQALQANVWMTCHEQGVFHEAPDSLWDDYLAVIDKREQKLLDLLQAPKTKDDIINAHIIYRKPREPKMFFEFGEWAIMGKHVQRLLDQGKVVEEDGIYRMV